MALNFVLFLLYLAASNAGGAATEVDCPAPMSGMMARVERVVDGDTIVLEGGERVRYIGVDTPESVHPRRPVEPFSKEAALLNKSLVAGKDVFILFDVDRTDRYGRLLGYVFAGDVFVNARLVREGLAREKKTPPNVAFRPLYVHLEKQASRSRAGIWGRH